MMVHLFVLLIKTKNCSWHFLSHLDIMNVMVYLPAHPRSSTTPVCLLTCVPPQCSM